MKTSKLKSLVLVAAMGMVSYGAMAQKTVSVPSNVSTAFSTQYPQANLKNWTMDHDQYVASFKYNKRDWRAYYSADANWLSSERDIKHMKTLPYDVRHSLRTGKFAAYHVDQIARVQTPARNMYKIRVDNNNGQQTAYENAGSIDNETLYYSERGRLIKTVGHDNE
jgi:hypothetical protein